MMRTRWLHLLVMCAGLALLLHLGGLKGAMAATELLKSDLVHTTYEYPVSGINRGRQADELILYYASSANQHTGTNEWGLEVEVVDGRISAIGGNNRPIPHNGLVLSGHGKAKDWLSSHAVVGAKVSVHGGHVHLEIDPETYVYLARERIEQAKSSVEHPQALLDPQTQQELHATLHAYEHALQQALEDGLSVEALLGRANEVIQGATEVEYRTFPLPVAEWRGVWHRPSEGTREAIQATLDRMASANMNVLFLETFYAGQTIYPSKVAPQWPIFMGWDPLAVWVEEAHARNIQVHLWVHAFQLGSGSVGPVLIQNPHWISKERNGSISVSLSPGKYFADPAHPEVRDFLSSLFTEMLTEYAVDGLHLDYVRYGASNGPENSSGYTAYSRETFRAEHGTDPLEIDPSRQPLLWAKWLQWQEDQVSSFVERIRHEALAVRSDVALSAAVIAEPNEAKLKRQNWTLWMRNGWLDFATPMIYREDTVWVANGMESVRTRSGTVVLTAGLGVYLGLTPHQTAQQVLAVRSAGSAGAALFNLRSLEHEHVEMLKTTVFRSGAVPLWPVRDAVHSIASHWAAQLPEYVEHGVVPGGELSIADRLADLLDTVQSLAGAVDADPRLSHVDRDVVPAIEEVVAQLNELPPDSRRDQLVRDLQLLLALLW